MQFKTYMHCIIRNSYRVVSGRILCSELLLKFPELALSVFWISQTFAFQISRTEVCLYFFLVILTWPINYSANFAAASSNIDGLISKVQFFSRSKHQRPLHRIRPSIWFFLGCIMAGWSELLQSLQNIVRKENMRPWLAQSSSTMVAISPAFQIISVWKRKTTSPPPFVKVTR